LFAEYATMVSSSRLEAVEWEVLVRGAAAAEPKPSQPDAGPPTRARRPRRGAGGRDRIGAYLGRVPRRYQPGRKKLKHRPSAPPHVGRRKLTASSDRVARASIAIEKALAESGLRPLNGAGRNSSTHCVRDGHRFESPQPSWSGVPTTSKGSRRWCCGTRARSLSLSGRLRGSLATRAVESLWRRISVSRVAVCNGFVTPTCGRLECKSPD
jgi:hypothetical protein